MRSGLSLRLWHLIEWRVVVLEPAAGPKAAESSSREGKD